MISLPLTLIFLAQAAQAAAADPGLADLMKIALGQGLNGVLFVACCVLVKKLQAKDTELRNLEIEYRKKIEDLKDNEAKKVNDGFGKLENLYNKQIEREDRSSRLFEQVRDAMRRIGVAPRNESTE